MSAGHTPGPYRAEGPDLFGDYNILHPADSLAVAAVVSNMRPPEEVAANAALFGAAHDLLVQLRFAVKLLSAFPALNNTAQVDAMRAAIARATGGQS